MHRSEASHAATLPALLAALALGFAALIALAGGRPELLRPPLRPPLRPWGSPALQGPLILMNFHDHGKPCSACH